MKTALIKMDFYKRCAALLVFLACAIPFAAAVADAEDYAVVHRTNSLNLRSGPSSSYSRLGGYPKGTWVEVIGERNNWYEVLCPDGKTGYMSKNYLDMGPSQRVNIGVVTNPKSTSFLNLRATPSYSAKVLGIYYNGVPFKILSYANGWYKVTVDGVNGYFREEYISRSYGIYGEDVATIVTPNNTALNLRSGPGRNHGVLRQYRGGEYIMVLAKSDDWWKVCADGRVGFMSSEFLKDGLLQGGPLNSSGNSNGSASNSKLPYGIVANPRSTQVLNLRQQPDTASLILDSFRNGVKVSILEQGSEWCHVTVEDTGDTGYMMTAYLTLHNLPARATRTVNHPDGTFVNLRRFSDINAAVLNRVPHGRTIEILTPGEEWCKVRYNGMTGYMVTAFLK